MTKLLFALIFLAVCAAAASAQEADTQSAPAVTTAQSGNFDAAMRLYKQKRYNDAIAEFQKIVDAEPKNAAAYYMMGYAHYVLDHHADAQAAFAKAFEANPAFDPRPYFRR